LGKKSLKPSDSALRWGQIIENPRKPFVRQAYRRFMGCFGFASTTPSETAIIIAEFVDFVDLKFGSLDVLDDLQLGGVTSIVPKP